MAKKQSIQKNTQKYYKDILCQSAAKVKGQKVVYSINSVFGEILYSTGFLCESIFLS